MVEPSLEVTLNTSTLPPAACLTDKPVAVAAVGVMT